MSCEEEEAAKERCSSVGGRRRRKRRKRRRPNEGRSCSIRLTTPGLLQKDKLDGNRTIKCECKSCLFVTDSLSISTLTVV